LARGSVLLEFDGFAAPRWFTGPRREVVARTVAEVEGALAEVEAESAAGRWAAGFVSYEAAPAFDPALRAHPPGPLPLVWFGIYDRPAEPPGPPSEETARAPGASGADPGAPGGAILGPLVPTVDRARYVAAVERIRARISAGDVYQVNHTFRLRGPFAGDPAALYRRLRAAQGRGLGALVDLGDRAVVSASPELFLERRGDLLRARPMKGTAPRGRWEEEDAAIAAALAACGKERAENVMIVDLVRNDLGRVAVPGSVKVTALLEVERYRTVHQLTSTVEAALRPGARLRDVLAAAFPCGSITGAPKAMATRIIAEEEEGPRGVYCGAIGVVAPGGDAALSVAIRTVALDLAAGTATAGVGGGITWGSDPAREWDEALAKGAFLAADPAPFELVETLRLEGGAYPLLAGHLARLASSARHLGFVLDPAAVEGALRREAEAAGGAPRRVRLLLSARGGVRTEPAPLPPPPAAPARVALSSRRVSRRDPTLFHKTTRRGTYDAARAERPELLDVLLANEEDEVTEFTIGNVVVELDGAQVTPPRDAGLLAGVMRGALLARGEVVERPVRVADLARARRLWLVNAVRGRVPVSLVG
jgi:para-aminobenzoate synthetase/4-amino-4-deoxychorismate lyase